MSKTCQHCGNVMEDAAVFCEKCGTACAPSPANGPVPPSQPNSYPVYAAQNKKKFSPKILITAGVCVVLVVALIFIIVGCAGNSPKGVVSKAMKAEQNFDYVAMSELSYECNFDPDKSLSEYKKDAEEAAKKLKESSKYDDMKKEAQKYKWEIVEVKDGSEDDIKSFKEKAERRGYKDTDKITDTKTVIVKVTKKENNDDEKKEEISVVKCNGKWYVLSF